jgi:formate--tetrahydrofolate ligase
MTSIPSSLEIAQAAELRPIADVAAGLGIEESELEPYGRYEAPACSERRHS